MRRPRHVVEGQRRAFRSWLSEAWGWALLVAYLVIVVLVAWIILRG